jgi:phosphoenolpyruvate carboxylase
VHDGGFACPDARAFLADPLINRDSLAGHGDEEVADLGLKNLTRLVAIFGFHLMALDVRQESSRRTEAVAENVQDVPGARRFGAG